MEPASEMVSATTTMIDARRAEEDVRQRRTASARRGVVSARNARDAGRLGAGRVSTRRGKLMVLTVRPCARSAVGPSVRGDCERSRLRSPTERCS